MEWKEEHDIFLCRETFVSQPFKFKERTVERGKIWNEIANRLNNCQTLKFRVNKRSVRERFKLMKEKFKRKIQEEEKASGIDVEPASELEQALEDIIFVHWKNLYRRKSWTPSKLRPKQTNSKPKKYAKKQWRASGKLKREKVKRSPRRKREEEATTLYSS